MSSNRGHQPIMPATAGGKAEAERTGAEIDEGSRRFGAALRQAGSLAALEALDEVSALNAPVRRLESFVVRHDGRVVTQGALDALLSQRAVAWQQLDKARAEIDQYQKHWDKTCGTCDLYAGTCSALYADDRVADPGCFVPLGDGSPVNSGS